MIFGRRKRAIQRLLLVEDEPLVAFDAEHLLTDRAFEIVATVDRVSDAIAVIESREVIHLVLLDIALADGSGIDVARAAAARGVPVVFVTGHCPEEARPLALGWLAKPYAERDLLATISFVEATLLGRLPRRIPRALKWFAASSFRSD